MSYGLEPSSKVLVISNVNHSWFTFVTINFITNDLLVQPDHETLTVLLRQTSIAFVN
jgi:hypothetical protein